MNRQHIVIVSPALSDANNGNWQTAKRWASMLGTQYRTRITTQWPDAAAASDSILIALHARRSAAAVQAWQAQHGNDKLIVVLTGTDLYRDIHSDTQAQQSLDSAKRLIVLQSLGLQALPSGYRSKTQVVLQSTTARKTLPKTQRRLHAVMVGHLRDEKSPHTLCQAAQLLTARQDIHLTQIGAGLDEQLAQLAQQTQLACPRYRWLGALAHGAARSQIQRAHVLVHASKMEGGAHVIMEAVCSGTPVIASRIAGNIGMLGEDYAGYFPWGDAAALAALLQHCKDDSRFLDTLRVQCAERALLFAPQAERTALLHIIESL